MKLTHLEGDFARANVAECKRSHRRDIRRGAIMVALTVFGLWIALIASTN